MGRWAEGKIEVPMELFWEWVHNQYGMAGDAERVYGVPKYNHENECIDISYAEGTDSHPETWAVKPKAVLEWDELKKQKEN